MPATKLLLFIKSAIKDAAGILGSKEGFKAFFGVSLYRNAIYLMLANLANAVLGFVFWIIVARFYSAEDVGLAASVISAILLVTSFSHLGLGFGLIRFLPNTGKNANTMINSSLTISILASILIATIFLAGLNFWSPALVILWENPGYLVAFVVFAVVSTLSLVIEQIFVAERRTDFVVIRNLIFSILKLPLPIMLAALFDSFGIFASWGISFSVALLVSLLLLLPRARAGYYPILAFSKGVINTILRFSFANYAASLLWSTTIYILPIMVLNLLGAELTAYFYIAWAIGSILFLIPTIAATSLFAEGSHDEEKLAFNTWRSLRLIFALLIPAIILVLVFADKLLLLFGSSYSENASTLLRILAISALPLTINVVYLSIKRVQMRLKQIIVLTAFIALITLVFSYFSLISTGINGVGIAWLISHGVVASAIIAHSLWKRR